MGPPRRISAYYSSWNTLGLALILPSFLLVATPSTIAEEPSQARAGLQERRFALWIRPDGKNRIEGLTFGTSAVPSADPSLGEESPPEGLILARFPIRQPSDPTLPPRVSISGQFPLGHWNLLCNTELIKRSEDEKGDFHIEIVIRSQQQEFVFVAISPEGTVNEERFLLVIPAAPRPNTQTESPPFKRLFWNAGLGISSLSFSESQAGASRKYSSLSFTGKLSINYPFSPPAWDAGIITYFTLLPVTRSYTAAVPGDQDPDLTARFLGVNFRAGYSLPAGESRWRWALHSGFYYTTMLVSSSTGRTRPPIGFTDLMGPQLFPTVRTSLPGGKQLLFFAKYSPISHSIGLMSLTNRELALGGSFSMPLKNQHPLSITLDLADLRFNVPSSSDYQVDSTSVTLGAGYGL